MNKITCPNCQSENIQGTKYCAKCGHELPVAPLVEYKIDKLGDVNDKIAKNKRKNKTAAIIGVIFGVIFISAMAFIVKDLFDNVVETEVLKMNASCPVMIDEYTRLESVSMDSKKTIRYNYSLVEWSKADINSDTLIKYMEPELINNMKTNPALDIFKKRDITFIHAYNDKDNELVVEMKITPEMYKE